MSLELADTINVIVTEGIGPAGPPGTGSSGPAGPANGLTGISVTGGLGITGAVGFYGMGGLQIFQYGNDIYWSGGSSNAPSSSATAGVTGISVTGAIPLTGLVNITGQGSIYIFTVGNEIRISGNISDNLPIIFNSYQIPSGVDNSPFIQFPQTFAVAPLVIGNIINSSGDPIIGYDISGIVTTGFYLSFSNTIRTSGYSFGYMATTGNAFYNFGSQGGGGGGTGSSPTNIVGLISTGDADLRYLSSGSGNQYYLKSNPNNFIRSGDVNTISGSLSERLSKTGTDLIALFNASAAGVSSLNALSGILNLAGQGNVSITTGVGTITISGNTGEYINFYKTSNLNNFSHSGNVEATGTLLQTQINLERNKNTVTGASISGGLSITGSLNINAGSNITLTQAGLNSFTIASSAGGGSTTNGVTGLSITGGNSISGAIKIIGTGNVIVTQQANTIVISGISLTSGSTLPFAFGNVNIVSGSGNSQFIQFAQNFLGTPIVLGNIYNNSGDNIVDFHTSGIVSSGFYLNLTDVLTTNNYYFHYLATTGLGYYDLATSLFGLGGGGGSSSTVVGIATGITGISITGGVAITGALNINAGSNITLTQVGQNSLTITSITGGGTSQNYIGSGTPNFIVAAISGSLYTDWFNQTFYMKITGTATDTEGWV